MAKVVHQLKLAWLKGMESLGTSASNLASSAKLKVQEINLETRRREILTEFSMTAIDLWRKGEKLPEALERLLCELSELEEKQSVLRAQKYASVEAKDSEAEGESPAEDGQTGEGETPTQEAVMVETEGEPAATPEAQNAQQDEGAKPSYVEGDGANS